MPERNQYEQVPYPGRSIIFTHPDRLATLARLRGLEPARIDRCRVLELGCGEGMNLLPMAELLPESEFVGIDFTARHIDTARTAALEMGLDNASFESRDIRDMSASDGTFDYIICHGVYSWVPQDVRDALLRVCREMLAPQGVAYVSFNTLPGWHFRRPVRDLMLHRVRGIEGPMERVEQGLEFAKLMARALPPESSPFGFLLNEYVESIDEAEPGGSSSRKAWLLHDEFNEVNEPVYFSEFAAHAARHGLRYLADAESPASLPARFPPWVKEELESIAQSAEDMEQYRDFLLSRMFRRTLLVHAERAPAVSPQLDLATLRPLFFRSEAAAKLISESRPASREERQLALRAALATPSPVTFRGPNESEITLSNPMSKAGLAFLGEEFPRTVPFDEVVRVAAGRSQTAISDGSVAALMLDLAQAFTSSSRLVSLHVHNAPCATVAGRYPLATKMVRFGALHGADVVTSVAHMQVEIDAVSRYLLPFLDGTRSRGDLLAQLQPLVDAGELDPGNREGESAQEALEAQLELSLEHWATRGLLLA